MAVAGFEKMLFDEVRDDFGIGLGGELVAFFDQLFLEAEIVFDDAVVHDDDFAGAIAMRMGIFFGGAAVRGPAGVADAVVPSSGLRRMASSRLRSLPSARRSCSWSPLPATAMPAES